MSYLKTLDVWLIYQCFLDNDEHLAEEYGKNFQLFQKNRAEIDSKNVKYELVKLRETMEETVGESQTLITIQNPYSLKVRPEKLASEILGLSASQVKKRIAREMITIKSTAQSLILECLSLSK